MLITAMTQNLDGTELHFEGTLQNVIAWLNSLDLATIAEIHLFPQS